MMQEHATTAALVQGLACGSRAVRCDPMVTIQDRITQPVTATYRPVFLRRRAHHHEDPLQLVHIRLPRQKRCSPYHLDEDGPY